MGNIVNVKIGAVSVTFGGVDLGHTKGGAEFSYKPKYADITVDETGETVRDKSLIGEEAMVKVRLAESHLANLALIMPTAESQAAGARIQFGSEAGARLLGSAQELVLRPKGAVDDSNDLVLYKAVVASEVPVAYTNDEERVIEVEFTALWDDVNGALGHFGTEIV